MYITVGTMVNSVLLLFVLIGLGYGIFWVLKIMHIESLTWKIPCKDSSMDLRNNQKVKGEEA